MSSRAFPTHPKDRDLYGAEVYIQSNAKKRGFTPLFWHIWRSLVREGRTAATRLFERNLDLFSVVSSRYLDRGQVWTVGTEDGKRTSQVSDLGGGAQEKTAQEK